LYWKDKCAGPNPDGARLSDEQVKAMYTYKSNKNISLMVIAFSACSLLTAPGSLAATKSSGAIQHNVLTLEHLKNASYQIPDLACGYTTVKLNDGSGEQDGIKAVFGRATFGDINKKPTAVVHLAYHTDELGWLQQLVLIQADGGKLLQVAEYGLDDREQVKDISFRNGEIFVESSAKNAPAGTADRLTRMRLSSTAEGCMLQASEWDYEPVTRRLIPHTELMPYLSQVEDRIGKCWSPTQKDRSEHVTVTFKIEPMGNIKDVHVSSSSEVSTADEAAVQAVQQAAPFPPLPAAAKDPLNVCFEFQAGVNLRQ
jgi:TonB family protein